MVEDRYSFQGDPLKIPVQVKKEEIVYIDRIIEGYGHLGLVTTVDGKKGLVFVQVTYGTKGEILEILANFPKEIKVLTDQEAQELLASI